MEVVEELKFILEKVSEDLSNVRNIKPIGASYASQNSMGKKYESAIKNITLAILSIDRAKNYIKGV